MCRRVIGAASVRRAPLKSNGEQEHGKINQLHGLWKPLFKSLPGRRVSKSPHNGLTNTRSL